MPLQTRCLALDNNTSTAMDHRSETVESTQQLRAMELSEEADKRAEAVQHLEQMRVAIQNTGIEHHRHTVHGDMYRLSSTVSMVRRCRRHWHRRTRQLQLQYKRWQRWRSGTDRRNRRATKVVILHSNILWMKWKGANRINEKKIFF